MNTKNIIKNGQTLKVAMTAMDAAAPVEATLQTALTDAKVAYQADMNGGTLNAVTQAQQALDAHRAAQTPTVTAGPSADYLGGVRDAAIYKAQDAWRG